MMEICTYNKCTGCFACANACSKKSIQLIEDKYGEIHPVIDREKCVECHLCQKVCPNNIEVEYNYPTHCFASWIDDVGKRRLCASGGIGTIISEYVITHKHGVVFGTSYDDFFIPRTTYAESVNELEKFKGSKYTQCVVGCEAFNQIKNFLKKGRYVVYIATPCQIAGLKGFLRKSYDNLILVDLICHGVSPTKYFKEELDAICSSSGKKLSEISDVRFRGNDNNNFKFSVWEKTLDGKKSCIYRASYRKNYYLAGFLQGITLRENCYSCNYACPERISDLTIGDFIWLGKDIPYDGPTRNVSSVSINTRKGEQFYREMSEVMGELHNIERSYSERLAYKPSLMESSVRHELNPLFRKMYVEYGYLYTIRKLLFYRLLKERMKYVLSVLRRKIIDKSRFFHKTAN